MAHEDEKAEKRRLDAEFANQHRPARTNLEPTYRNRKFKGSAGKRAADAARKRRQRWRWRTGEAERGLPSDGHELHEVIGWVLQHNVDEVKELFEVLAALPGVRFDATANCLRYMTGNSAGVQPGSLTSPRKALAALKRRIVNSQ